MEQEHGVGISGSGGGGGHPDVEMRVSTDGLGLSTDERGCILMQ